jgi:surfeit locus 1 family protein
VSLKTLKFGFWWVTMVAILGVAVTLRLGFWQLSRANEKLALQDAILQQAALPPLDARALTTSADLSASLYRNVKLKGHWLAQHTLFLDNRQMYSKPGLFVVTPFEFEDKATAIKKTILVQRGWIARNFIDRQQLPQIPTTSAEETIFGRIAPSPSKLYAFKGADAGRIRQNIDIAELAKEFKIELLNISLLQLDEGNAAVNNGAVNNDGLLRHWLQPSLGVDKNHGYMFQWWAMSGLIALLYVWFQLIRPRMRSKT